MKKNFITFCVAFSLSTTAVASSVDNIRWIAQDYKPYSYVDGNAKKTGMAIEIIGEILAKTGSSKTVNDIEVSAFSRSFIRRNNDENTAFFPFAKVSGREKYFKWIGPIALDEPVLFAKKSKNIRVIDEKDLKKYNIAGKDGYNAVKILQDISNSVSTGDTDSENMDKLKNDKVDMVVCNKLACEYAMKDQSMNVGDYEIVYKMGVSDLSIAFNKDTDDALINQISEAFEEVKQSAKYKEIVKRYEK